MRLSPLIAIAAAVVVGSGQVAAQTLFPGAAAQPFDGNRGLQRPTLSSSCMDDFQPLREEAERRGRLIRAASDRHAPPDEACKLIGSFGEAERQMIDYVGAHLAECGIPAQVLDQLRSGHEGTEMLQKKVCRIASQAQPGDPSVTGLRGSSSPARTWPPKGPTGDFDGAK